MNLLNGLLALLAERQMPQEHRRVERQGVHILGRGRVHLAGPGEHGALRLRLGRRDDEWHAHELQQALALCIVLPRDPDGAAAELFNLLGRTRLLCLFDGLLRLGLALEALGELPRLELGRRAVEDVDGLDAVVGDA